MDEINQMKIDALPITMFDYINTPDTTLEKVERDLEYIYATGFYYKYLPSEEDYY